MIAALSQKIVSPDPIAAVVLDLIRFREVTNVDQIIDRLNSGNPLLTAHTAGATAPRAATDGKAANQVYYFDIAPGTWTGTFTFQVTSWSNLWRSSMSLKNKLLATAMDVFQRVFGSSSISSEMTPYGNRGSFGAVVNQIRIHKSWFGLLQSHEQYTLNPDGSRVGVDAHVSFGPFSFLFREHDVYPARVFDCGMLNIYHIKLLGTRFIGKYEVQSDRTQVDSTLVNGWASAHEILTKAAAAAR